MINAAAFVLVVFLVTWFGLRPMTAALTAQPATAGGPSFEDVQRSLPQPDVRAALADGTQGGQAGSLDMFDESLSAGVEDIRKRIKPAPQDRLARMVDLNDERTAQILRKWARQEAS